MMGHIFRKITSSNCCGVRRTTDSTWSWVVCLCGLVSNTIVTGCLGSFAVMFPAILDEFSTSKGTTALVGSVGMSFAYLCGPIAGKLTKKFGCRCIAIFGSLMMMSGLIFSSKVPNMYLLFVSYSTISAFGMCCIYTSAILIVTKYFDKRRYLAIGIIAMGPGAGVFVMTPIAQTSLDMIGWRYTFVVLSGFALMATLLSCTFDPAIVNEEACYDDDIGQQMVNREVDVPFWKNPAWTVMTLSTAIISFGAPAPQVHMVRYCEELGYTSTKGSKLYIYFGAASLIFRVTTGKFLEITKQSQWAKPQYFYQVSVFIIGITTVLCPLSNNFSWLTLYFTLFGCADGCFCTCMNVVILNTVTEKQRDQSYGFWLGAFAIPMALGPTVAGFMADAYGTYKPAFYMTGSVIILSGLVIFILLFWKPHQPECNEILLESTSIIVERETVV